MLYLFGPKETDFINGDSDLIHNTYDEVVDRSKGFYLKFKIALDKDKRYKNIKKEMIISAHTPDGWNQFRVFDIYNHSNHVEVVATQLHYDLNYKKVFPFVVNKTTAQTALNVFVQNFKSDLPNFKFTSNIKDVHSFSTDDDLERLDEGHNALEILNRIASRWGGELQVDGYNVHLVSKLGKFTNALLYEHKNISEFVDETSMSEIITRIHAVSRFRPERAEGDKEEPKEVTIKVVVDSPLINEYAQVYEEDYTNNDARTRDQLIAWARLKYSTNNVDKPTRSIQVETNIIDGQEINYGDDLVLKYTKHDVDEIIRCVGYQYNPNSRQYISVTLGSNINSLASTITGSVHDSTKNQLSNIEKQVQIIKYAANNVNRVTTGPLPIPDPIEGDMWYYHPEGRPNEVELRIFQDGGWVTIVSDMTGENVRKAIAELETEAEGLAADIVASDQKADEAKEAAGLAKSATEALDLITKETAGKMVDVEQIAADAKTNASNALAKAREAATNSSGALALAGQAATDAQTAIDDAATAQTDAQSALSKANGVESSVSTLSKEVDTVSGKVALKADQTEVDTVKGTVSTHTTTLSQHATAITSKADQTEVDTVKGTVNTHTTKISQNATAITSKAAQTEVDTVKGTVSTHTSTLSQHAKDISARLTQTQVNNLVSGKGYSTVSYVDTEISATAGAIRTEMTAVEGKIPTQIGGRNLLIGSKDYSGTWVNKDRWNITSDTHKGTLIASKTGAWCGLGQRINVFKGEQYTFSAYIKSTSTRVDLYLSNNSNSAGLLPSARGLTLKPNTWTYVKHSFAVTSDGLMFPRFEQILDTEALYVSSLKLEKGNVATDWSPAPEDMMHQNDFNTFKAEYDQSAEGWSTKLQQIEQAGYATKTWSNQTFATPQSITTALKSYAKTTDLNGLATESYVGAQISATASGINTSLTRIENKVDDIEFGGANLIKNSEDLSKKMGGYSGATSTVKPIDMTEEWGFSQAYEVTLGVGTSAIKSVWSSIGEVTEPMVPGQKYTHSFWIKNLGSSNGMSISTNGLEPYSPSTYLAPGESIRFQYTGVRRRDYDWYQIHFRSMDAGSVIKFAIGRFQLEKGNKATDWSPAPYDVMDYTDTQINIEAGKIEQTISKVKNSPTETITGYNTLKNNVDSMVQAIGSTGGKIAQMVMTDSVFKTTVAKQSDVFKNYRIYAMSYSNRNATWAKWSGSRIIKPNGSLASSNASHSDRSYFLYVINEAGSEVHSKVYDVYMTPALATTLANDIKSFTNRQYLIFLMGSHAPTPNRTGGGLPEAIYQIGGSPEIFINEDWSGQPAYLLIGKPGLGKGRGYEYFVPSSQGGSFDITVPVLNGSTPFIDSSIQAVNSQVSSIEQKANSIQALVGTTKESVARAVMTSSLWETEVTDVLTDMNSTVSQLSNSWALTLKSGNDIKTQINATTNGIRLASKLIHLSGTSLIDNATIKSAMIDTLDAAKITTGILNARNIRVINLDANSISGNEASFIRAMFTNRNSALQITGTGITVSQSNGRRTFEVGTDGVHFYSDTGPGAYITTHNVITWNGSSWVDSGVNSVMFASELNHSIGIGYKIWSNGKYVTKDAIRLHRSGSGTPELQVNLPIKNVDYQRGMVSGENGTYFRNTQDSAGIWMGDNGKLCLITYGKLYNSTSWLN